MEDILKWVAENVEHILAVIGGVSAFAAFVPKGARSHANTLIKLVVVVIDAIAMNFGGAKNEASPAKE